MWVTPMVALRARRFAFVSSDLVSFKNADAIRLYSFVGIQTCVMRAELLSSFHSATNLQPVSPAASRGLRADVVFRAAAGGVDLAWAGLLTIAFPFSWNRQS